MLPSLYQAQAVQGWQSGMLAIVDALLDGQIDERGRMLEIGCGGGQFLRHWRQRHHWQSLVGVDLHSAALPSAQFNTHCTAHLSQADLTTLPFAPASFDTIVALDVFDQRGVDLPKALAEAQRLLKPKGVLLLRVSAYGWLYGAHDIAFNTGQRFDNEELQTAIEAAGLRVQRITHANTLLAAPIILSRWLQKRGWIQSMIGLYDSRWTNRLFEWSLKCEAQLLKEENLPFGVSLYVVAQM